MSTDNTIRRRTFLAASLAAAASGIAACGFGDDGDGDGGSNADGPQEGGTLRVSMLPVAHLDPAISDNYSFGQIMMLGLWEGLVVHDANDPAQVVPGVAESWDISEDGLTYTFHLRSDAKWSNGDPVTAEDFEWNWKRLLTPGISGEANPSAVFPTTRAVVAGAADYFSGATKDFGEVGVKAPDEATLEITLTAPNPDFLLMLADFWGLPLHPATVEELGEKWLDPNKWVSNGAYILEDFRVNQGAVLVPNEEYWDAGNYHLDRWEVTFNDGGTTADLLSFQNDEIDITGRIEEDLEAVTTSDVADQVISSPTNQYRFLSVMNSRNPVLHDVSVRQALSMAIDREALAEVAKPATAGATLVPEGVDGYDQVPGVEYDVEGAQGLLDQAGYPGGEGMPPIVLLDFQKNAWVEALAQMWRDGLGIEVKLDIVEVGVYTEKRAQFHPEDYTGFIVASNAVNPPTLLQAARTVLPPPGEFFEGRQFSPVGVAQDLADAEKAGKEPPELLAMLEGKRHPQVESAIKLANEAIAEQDPDAQQATLIEALIAREQAYTLIPVLWGGWNLLVQPRVKNLHPWIFTSVFTTKGVTIEE